MIPLDQIEGIISFLLDHFPNGNRTQSTGPQQDVATTMCNRPVIDWNLRVQYCNPTKNLTHPSGPDTENSPTRDAVIQMDHREIQIL